nr:nucleosome assembly protein 1-like 1 [Camelus dromedarius]
MKRLALETHTELQETGIAKTILKRKRKLEDSTSRVKLTTATRLVLEEVALVDASKLRLPLPVSQRRFPRLAGLPHTTARGAVSPGRFSGCPGGFPVRRPPQAPCRLLFPAQPASLAAPPPPPGGPLANSLPQRRSARRRHLAVVVAVSRVGSAASSCHVSAQARRCGLFSALPLAVTQRVKALKNLQARHAQVEAQFYKDLFDLEKKYAAFYEPLFDRRAAIINAIHEPSEGECQWAVGVAEGAWEEMDAEPEGKGQINGIPHFWLTAFKNVKMLGRMIRGNDELALEHLTDVKIKFSGVEEPMSFTVEFIFESNEYFFNKVLTKTYRMRSDPDDSDPFFSRGPEIISSTGCEIYWKEGKDLTMKTLELQKCEGRGSVVPATGKVPSRSFFTYFYPPDSPEGRVLDIATDYKLGYFFREVLVPKSVLFFTKEATEYQCEDSDEEVQEAEGPRTEEPGRGPEKDVDPAEGSPGEASSQA